METKFNIKELLDLMKKHRESIDKGDTDQEKILTDILLNEMDNVKNNMKSAARTELIDKMLKDERKP